MIFTELAMLPDGKLYRKYFVLSRAVISRAVTLSTLARPLKLPFVNIIHPQSNTFFMGVKIKAQQVTQNVMTALNEYSKELIMKKKTCHGSTGYIEQSSQYAGNLQF